MKQAFRDAVYQIVAAIPAGSVCSYGQVARLAGYPRHARLVGRLLSQLPVDSRLPWHRVLRSDGLIALPGPAADEQIERLTAEGVTVIARRVSRRCFQR